MACREVEDACQAGGVIKVHPLDMGMDFLSNCLAALLRAYCLQCPQNFVS